MTAKRVRFVHEVIETWPDWFDPEVWANRPEGARLPEWKDDPCPPWAPEPDGPVELAGDDEEYEETVEPATPEVPTADNPEPEPDAEPEYVYEKRDKDKRNKRMAKYMREVYRPRLAREIQAGRKALAKKGRTDVH